LEKYGTIWVQYLNENGETITKALTAGTDDTSRWLQR
jgi:hypothetical protein